MELFNLIAKITLDSSEYKKKLGDAAKETNSFGGKVKSGLGTVAKGVGKGIAALGKATVAGIAAVGAATVAMGKKSLEAYANYEQLVGGVETLFKENADIVQEYAANAYKTAGLSANQYMETVTGFSASLLQSLGGDTKKAAKLADTAIIDMADNANKMGTSMESIQNAYQGFAKQNYTMLDNLKLGYGGTKSEMGRLLEDAEKISGVKYDISSYADVVKAIHVVQTEMGITGTTAEEASKTISGSVNATKAAWQNLLVGIADDNADFGKLIDEFVDSAVAAGSNLIPRVQKIIEGAAKLITAAAEKLLPTVVSMIAENLPLLTKSAVSLIKTFGTAIVDNLPKLLESAVGIVKTLVSEILYNLPMVIDSATEIITTIVDALTEPDTLHTLITASIDIIGELATGLIDNLPDLIDAAVQLAVAIADELIHYDWWGLAKKIFASLKDSFKRLFTGDEDEPEKPQTPAPKPHGRHASGLKYVPFDEYHAVLHRGERVLTSKETKEYERRNAEPIIAVENNAESVKVMQQMLDELRATRQDMYTIILSALRTNSEGFSVSERDMARLVKHYAFT